MTEQILKEVENRFLELRKEYTESQWKRADILSDKVDELASSDLPLAYRLMQRVKNLDPSAESRRQMTFLLGELKKHHPELAQSYSSESSGSRLVKRGARFIATRMKAGANSENLKKVNRPFYLFVLIPFLVFAFYQAIWASDRYESRAKLILKQPDAMATLDPAMALISGFGGPSVNTDNELLKSFVYSNDMIDYLETKLGLVEHFSSSEYDFYSRLENEPTQEDLNSYFQNIISITVEEMSGVIEIKVQGFEPSFARKLNELIVERAEWYINEIGHSLAKEQLSFVQNEHSLTEQRLQKTKAELLAFQRKHGLLDPEAEGMALQQITYGLEAEIASKQAQLRALSKGMSDKAPAVINVKSELESLEAELEAQRSRLSNNNKGANSENSVGELLAKFADLKIDLELALKAYTASQVSLEKSRIEAYRQLKYLVVVESPTLPQESSYPQVFYNLTLFLAVALMLFGIGRIIMATVEELR